MAKLKYWVALGEHSLFTKGDNHLMHVYPWGQPGAGTTIQSHFIEADDIESARAKLHAIIDERLDHELHMRSLEKTCDRKKEKREAFLSSPVIPDSDINQLTIGEFVGGNPKEPRSSTDGVLNLEDLL